MDIFATAYQSIKPRLDDDFADRANYYFTSSAFLLFALVLSARQWVGQPIECWVPAEFKGAWEQYTEDYCFVQNTYWLPLHTPFPREHRERRARQIGYYQWVPFILALEALFFCFPYMVWWILNWQSGLDIHSIVKTAKSETEMAPEETINAHVNSLAAFIREMLQLRSGKGRKQLVRLLQRRGCYVTSIYLVIKLLYLLNSIGQLFLLTMMLSTGRSEKGFNMFFDILYGEDWSQSGIFPRVTMCDFDVRVMGNTHSYTVQCVLMINMFNEKIFLLLWFWVLMVVVLNALSCIYWVCRCLSLRHRVEFVNRYLRTRLVGSELRGDRGHVRKFVQTFLQSDGVLLLRKLAYHCGDMLSTKLIYVLYDSYVLDEQSSRRDPRKTTLLSTDPSGDDEQVAYVVRRIPRSSFETGCFPSVIQAD